MFQAVHSNSGYRWQLIRLRAGSVCEATLLSSRFFAMGTHFLNTTIPCPGDKCALCEMLAVRGLFYLGAMVDSRLSIVELGSQSASDLEQHLKLLHGGLRAGVVVRLKRSSARRPIHTEFERFAEGVEEVDRFVLCQRVMALYKFPCANPAEDFQQYEQRIRAMTIRRNMLHAQEILKRQNTGVEGR